MRYLLIALAKFAYLTGWCLATYVAYAALHRSLSGRWPWDRRRK